MAAPASTLSTTDLAAERTDLALIRTTMALERSLMAWLRTSIALISFGFTIFKFIPAVVNAQSGAVTQYEFRNIGVLMSALGVVLLFFGLVEYHTSKKKLLAGTARRPPVSMAALASISIILLGLFVITDMYLEATYARIINNLIERTAGPLHYRIYIQPAVAIVLGVIDGVADARAGRPPYFWALFTQAGYRMELVRDGLRSIGKVIIAAILLDIAYQIVVEGFVYPLETVIVAFVLAVVPYVIVRGPLIRFAKKVVAMISSRK